MKKPVALVARDVAPRTKPSNYPEPFASRMKGREKRGLGDAFGLTNFGVNLTRLAPGAVSALRHAHSAQDKFVYVLEGEVVLRTDEGETLLTAGMCAGFAHGCTVRPRCVPALHLLPRTTIPYDGSHENPGPYGRIPAPRRL
jgi:uncharacterized cupin superfamily protein